MAPRFDALRRGKIFPFLVAFVAVAIAAILSAWLNQWIQQTVLVLFVAAVVFNAWLSGLRGGITAAALSVVASHFTVYKNEPLFSARNIAQLALFLFVSVLIGGLFKKLRDEHRLLRITLNSIGDAVIVTDAAGLVRSMNPTAEKLTGWCIAEARGQSVEKVLVLVNGKTRQPDQNPVVRALREGTQIGMGNHARLVSRNGTEIPIEDSAAPIRRKKKIIGAIMVFRDVTRQRKAELQLQDNESQFRRIFEAASEGIWILNSEGRIILVNDRMAELLGYPKDEMLGHFKWDFVFPEDVETIKHFFEQRRKGVVMLAQDVRFRRRDGGEVETLMSARPIFDDEKSFQGVLDMFTDFTSRKQVERELARTRAELKQHAENLEATVTERTAHLQRTIAELEGVSYSLSHDLRAPLRTIGSFSQIILKDAGHKLDEHEKDLLTKIVRAANRLDQLIQDILIYTRATRERIGVHSVNVELLLRQIIAERPEFQAPNAQIEIRSPIEHVCGHDAYLTQCITNLLDNAVKFVEPGAQPRVRIWHEPLGENIRLWFEDNGIGIPKDAQEKIFGIFQRAHPENKYPGTGIGLAIVRKAAERMGGSVGVESDPGKGSRFWLQLPRAT